MTTPFDNIPDEKLTELDIAERDWMRAQNRLEETIHRVAREGELAIQAAKLESHTAWVKWVALKPYVDKRIKEHLGIKQ